uniref:NADH dehydrogenase subunit 6 n=1 Tax=Neocerura liturata TaxID=1892402 RepID=UPI001FAF6E22|nr:NADH dehydrogenase subunit 6 [Neocerura liturata]UNP54674.1 NADH dehydrogenase subunit 6 [Neocerura liturata]
MMKMFLSSMIILISTIMFFLNNPLSMGIMILLQTLMTCLLSSMMIKTYWFSYILFLTFLGGLLVMFIYVSSIASNEIFNMTFFMKIFIMWWFIMIFMMQLYMNNLTWINLSINSDMEKLNNMNMIFNTNIKINLNKLYNNQTFMMMMMMIIYLFITLITVVKITNIFYGPIRTFI